MASGGTKYCRPSAPAILARSTQLDAVEHRSHQVDSAAASVGRGPLSAVKGSGVGRSAVHVHAGRVVGVFWRAVRGTDARGPRHPAGGAGWPLRDLNAVRGHVGAVTTSCGVPGVASLFVVEVVVSDARCQAEVDVVKASGGGRSPVCERLRECPRPGRASGRAPTCA